MNGDEPHGSQLGDPGSPGGEEHSTIQLAHGRESRPLVITGMHRSGTSLVASLLQRAGVDVGSELVAPNEGNPHGYFEDCGFLRFHEKLLRHCPHRFLVQDRSSLKLPGPEDIERARQLISDRKGHPIWGFKDPRTSLFLDFWADLLPPAACFLFVFRPPIDVMLSLARRGFSSELEVAADPLVGLRAWEVYNRSLLTFYRLRPERCFLGNIYDAAADPASFLEAVIQKLELPLDTEGADELVHRSELSRSYSDQGVEGILKELAPRAHELYQELSAEADLSPVINRSSRPREGSAKVGWLKRASRLLTDFAGQRMPVRQFLALVQATLDPRTKPFRGDRLRAQISGLEDQILDLRTHAGNLEQRVAELSENLAGTRIHAQNLESLRRQDQQQLEALERHASNLDELQRQDRQQLDELGRHAANLEGLHEQDQERIAVLEAHARNLEAELGVRNEQVAEFVAHSRNLQELRSLQTDHIVRLRARVRDLEEQLGERGESSRSQSRCRTGTRPRRRPDETTSSFRIRAFGRI